MSLPQRVGGTGISLRQPKLRNDMSPARVAQTNWTFVETLLKVRPRCETIASEILSRGAGTEEVWLHHTLH